MARKVVLVSDLTGKEIDVKDSAVVTIRYSDARRGQVVLDVNASEVEELARKGPKQGRRGRRPKYLTPGVYVGEVSSGARPISAVGASTAAVGEASGRVAGARGGRPLGGPDPMGAASSLDGRRFRGAEMGEQGEASAETVFEYHEDSGLVWARYEGGAVRLGFLVGTRDGDRVDFRYSQLNEAGETASGHCSSVISVLPDGRLRLEEDWKWESKTGAGRSAIEEEPTNPRQ